MPNPWDDDTEYQEYVVQDVRPENATDFILVHGNNSNLETRVTINDEVIPKIGERLRIYGKPFVSTRGIMIGKRMYGYQTVEEYAAEHKAFWDKIHAEEREHFPEFDRRYAALPEPFRKRIDQFRRVEGFRESLERMELRACEDAITLAKYCGTAEEVDRFRYLTRPERVALCPQVDDGRASDQTANVIVDLAYWYLYAPERLGEVAGVFEHIAAEGYGREQGFGGPIISRG